MLEYARPIFAAVGRHVCRGAPARAIRHEQRVGSVLLTRALGTALATTLVIASQIVTAILLDHFGALGLERRRINAARVLAMLR
jgi:hypothetical protein